MEGCSEIIGYEDLQTHEKECLEQVVTCDHCEGEIKRAKLSEHQVRPTECKFNRYRTEKKIRMALNSQAPDVPELAHQGIFQFHGSA